MFIAGPLHLLGIPEGRGVHSGRGGTLMVMETDNRCLHHRSLASGSGESGAALLGSEDDAVRLRSPEYVFREEGQAAFRGQLKSAINDAFCDPPSREWFFLCQSYVRAKKLESFVEIMQARHGFFRGLFVALVIAVVMLVIATAWVLGRSQNGDPSPRERKEHALVIVLCVLGVCLSYVRKEDFYKYYSQETYRAFYADYVLSEKNDARVPCPRPSVLADSSLIYREWVNEDPLLRVCMSNR